MDDRDDTRDLRQRHIVHDVGKVGDPSLANVGQRNREASGAALHRLEHGADGGTERFRYLGAPSRIPVHGFELLGLRIGLK
jgi:hypothetical protein